MAKKYRFVDILVNTGLWSKRRWYGVRIGKLEYGANSLYIRSINLSGCYARPSQAKEEIFADCEYLSLDIRDILSDITGGYVYVHTGVSSYNCMMFTYAANFSDENGQLIARLYITKTRTELDICPDYIGSFCMRENVYE